MRSTADSAGHWKLRSCVFDDFFVRCVFLLLSHLLSFPCIQLYPSQYFLSAIHGGVGVYFSCLWTLHMADDLLFTAFQAGCRAGARGELIIINMTLLSFEMIERISINISHINKFQHLVKVPFKFIQEDVRFYFITQKLDWSCAAFGSNHTSGQLHGFSTKFRSVFFTHNSCTQHCRLWCRKSQPSLGEVRMDKSTITEPHRKTAGTRTDNSSYVLPKSFDFFFFLSFFFSSLTCYLENCHLLFQSAPG